MRRCQNTACEGLPHGPSLKTHRIANSTDSLGALVSFHRIRWHEFGAHTLVDSLDDHHAHEMAITGGAGGYTWLPCSGTVGLWYSSQPSSNNRAMHASNDFRRAGVGLTLNSRPKRPERVHKKCLNKTTPSN